MEGDTLALLSVVKEELDSLDEQIQAETDVARQLQESLVQLQAREEQASRDTVALLDQCCALEEQEADWQSLVAARAAQQKQRLEQAEAQEARLLSGTFRHQSSHLSLNLASSCPGPAHTGP